MTGVSDAVAMSSGADDWSTKATSLTRGLSVRLSDGPHGLRVQDAGAASLDLRRTIPATCFPPAVGLGATWNPELIHRVGGALAREAGALAVDVVLGPGVNIKRSPLCGRNFEYFSEDPYLTGELALGMVRGLQEAGVGACVKHFAVNNQETDRMRVDAVVDDRTLREIYLPAFERTIVDGAPWMVMSSYNSVNGTTMSQNAALLTGVLRDEWGYVGVVVSDWAAVYDRVESVRAGLDLEMPHADNHTDVVLQEAVDSGRIPRADVERAARRVAALTDLAHQQDARTEFDPSLHHALAVEAARQAVVLLKNDDATLPIMPGRIAVFGDLAASPRFQGAGSSFVTATEVDTALETLAELADVRFLPDAFAESTRSSALELAAASDYSVVFLGLGEIDESEGYDRSDIRLPAPQVNALREISAVARKVVVVLTNGGVVSTSEWDDAADAVVEGWLLGQGGGRAIAEVLLGLHSPSGRLAETIPERLEDCPSYLHFPGVDGGVIYGERVYVGYRGYSATGTAVAYPFGHGLSYTRFDYSDLVVSAVGEGDELRCSVSFTVTNTGPVVGAEVAQLYVEPHEGAADRPPYELRGFSRVELAPGEARKITLELGPRAFARWSTREARWLVESGSYGLRVGASSLDVRLTSRVRVAGNERRRPLSARSTLAEWMADPHGALVIATDAVLSRFAAQLGEADETTALMLEQVPIEKVAALFGLRSYELDLDVLAAQANAAASSASTPASPAAAPD